MTKSHSDKFVSSVQDFAFSQEGSTMILRCLGYGLLVLALFDVVEMFVPPNFMNPAWEFQTGDLCWMINGTICDGSVQSNWYEKMKTCRSFMKVIIKPLD